MKPTPSDDARGSQGAVLVTGASRGIGKAIAALLLGSGRRVVLLARDRDALRLAAEEHDGATIVVNDLLAEDRAGVDPAEAAVADAIELAGPLDGLICAAGVALHAPLDEITPEQIKTMFRLHFTAPLYLSRAFARQGRPGSIVHISSTLATRSAVGRTVYSASKAALESMTKTLALELAPRGIRVNAVAPGVVDTAMTAGLDLEALGALHPLGIGAADDVARAAVYLLDARWTTGSILTVDGGLTAG